MGSRPIARLAGHHDAAIVTLPRRVALPARTHTSKARTPRKIDERNAVNATASSRPAATPAPLRPMPRPRTRRMTDALDAPSARRIANSRLRSVTMSDTIP